MEEDYASVAAGDGLEAVLESSDLVACLTIDLPQKWLAEIRDLRTGKASDEALAPDDADVEATDLEDRVRAFQNHDSCALQR